MSTATCRDVFGKQAEIRSVAGTFSFLHHPRATKKEATIPHTPDSNDGEETLPTIPSLLSLSFAAVPTASISSTHIQM